MVTMQLWQLRNVSNKMSAYIEGKVEQLENTIVVDTGPDNKR